MLRQLVRHDRNVKRGLTPLNRIDDDLIALCVTKIAVSPYPTARRAIMC